jgi:hypothetical protein
MSSCLKLPITHRAHRTTSSKGRSRGTSDFPLARRPASSHPTGVDATSVRGPSDDGKPRPPCTRLACVGEAFLTCRGAATVLAYLPQRRRMPTSPSGTSEPGRRSLEGGRRRCIGRTTHRATRCSTRSVRPGCTDPLDPPTPRLCSSQHALPTTLLSHPPSWQNALP